MQLLKNMKFVRKIQLGFLFLAAISTVTTAVGFFQLTKMLELKNQIFEEYVQPQDQVNIIFSDFQKCQFLMMKFSSPEFASNVQDNLKEYTLLKKTMDIGIDSLIKQFPDPESQKNFTEIKKIWSQYKSSVADAIISASVTQTYDLASVISTTTGEEVGQLLSKKFEHIRRQLEAKSTELNSTVKTSVVNSLISTGIGAFFGTVIFLFCALYLAPTLSKPINNLKEIVLEFTLGNYDVQFENKSHDEIGELAEMFKKLQSAQKEKISAAERIASGIIDQVIPASEKDTLANAFNKETETIKELLQEANKLIKANEEGRLSLRGDVSKFKGEWANLIKGMNSILDASVAPINEASRVLELMAAGNLDTSVNGDYLGDHQVIKKNINKLNHSLNEVFIEFSGAVKLTQNTASEISSSTEEMAAGAEEQSQQTDEVAGAIEQMTRTILDTSKNASIASQSSKNAGDIAHQGGLAVEDTIKGMNRIAEVVEASAETVQKLGKSSVQIGEIVEVIEDIADQTNLLALNAAIEAARAGEQGRGFAVVADEVRKLAERTTKATKEISKMIQQIQEETSGAVTSMAQGKEEVEKGKVLANKSGTSLKEIIKGTVQVYDVIMQVAAASEEQSSASEEISKSIEGINNVTRENTAGIQQIARKAEELNNLTTNLEKLIGQFRLKNVKDNESEYDRYLSA